MSVPVVVGRRFVCVGTVLMMTVVPVILPPDFAVYAAQNLDDKAPRSWPMFGGSPGRNMVNLVERNLPADWCVQEGKLKNIKWMADLGDRTFGSPVVAHGKVFVATNNGNPRDPAVKGRRPVMMAFRETDGQFLWQIAHDFQAMGIAGPPHNFRPRRRWLADIFFTSHPLAK
ncbi:MAG: PQQ-binding-like beta-propeller repeat protein [Planctomycetes bacterium]|nr:PQQ-binding-like beta-propeller repeat protein [Planctomycetota bacterium]